MQYDCNCPKQVYIYTGTLHSLSSTGNTPFCPESKGEINNFIKVNIDLFPAQYTNEIDQYHGSI